MKILEVKSLIFPEVKLIHYQRFTDHRGYFTEIFRESDLVKVIPDIKIKQINDSFSQKGVLRGFHSQWNPYMAKLVRVLNGKIIDFFLDIRIGSPTFGKISGIELSGNSSVDSNDWIWVAVGFVHGILALEESTIEYLCTGEYNPNCEVGINPLSADIDWSIADEEIKNKFEEFKKKGLVISERDRAGLTLAQWKEDEKAKNFVYAK